MTDEQAGRVLARMVSAWPRSELSDATTEVWLEHLAPKRFDLAAECVRRLEVGLKWFPSLAEFEAEYHAAAHHAAVASSDERGLPEPQAKPAPAEVRDSALAEAREAIRRAKAKLARQRNERAGEMGRILAEHEERSR